MLFLDLDRFKLINDTFGHEAGDQLLITVAERLRASTRPGDVVARIGGDEFTILLLNVSSEQEVIRVAERVIQEITEPIDLPGNREIVISTSIGIVRPRPSSARAPISCVMPIPRSTVPKSVGETSTCCSMRLWARAIKERVALEADLRRAIEREQLLVLYQPKFDLASGHPVAVEAFVRWNHPERGWITPATFVPIAEEIGLDAADWPVGLREACREAVTWPAVDGEPLS